MEAKEKIKQHLKQIQQVPMKEIEYVFTHFEWKVFKKG